MNLREWIVLILILTIGILGHSETVAEAYACHVLGVPVCGGHHE